MSKFWVSMLTIVALAAIIIPSMRMNNSENKSPIDQRRTTESLSVKREQALKLTTVNNDMSATALLCTTECSKDFQQFMTDSGNSEKLARAEVKNMMDEHHHMQYVSWQSGTRSVERGSLPKTAKDEASNYVKAGKEAVAQGKQYVSQPFTDVKGSRYIVLGIADSRSVGIGTVGVIKQDHIKQVENQQKRNLRLVPYPAEGNYRIESVHPNSTSDMTVKTGEDNGNASHYFVKDAVVHFSKKPSADELAKIKQEIQAEPIQQLGDTVIFRSKTIETKELIQYFNDKWPVEYTEPHYLYLTNESASNIPNDALYADYQWNLPSIETEEGWNVSKGSDGVIIAVLDTGVQLNHPDLSGKLIPGTNIVDPAADPEDDVGHGTHVAGIIGATVNNNEGVAGVSWYNKIMPVKVLDSSGAGSTYSVAQGIIWAVDNGAKVINMSLGNYAQAEFLHDAIKYAYDRDVVLIAASGNDNTDRPGFPAAYPEVFAVAATTNNKEKASFSNYGDYIDVAAPGDSIASTYIGGQYAALSGTSMASPHAAALAGLIRSVNPDLTNEEVMEIMRKSAIDLGASGKDNYFGYGEIDVNQALQAASGYGGMLQTFPNQVERRLNRIANKYTK